MMMRTLNNDVPLRTIDQAIKCVIITMDLMVIIHLHYTVLVYISYMEFLYGSG